MTRTLQFFTISVLVSLLLLFVPTNSSSAGSTTASAMTSTVEPSVKDNDGALVLRLYFVRHGQTQANLDGIVVGQLDSPLTDFGIQQARAAGRSAFLPRAFWRRYTSDLGRAQQTAQLILAEKNDAISVLKMDKRLRERAKGIREGLSKKLNYEQAMEYRRENHQEQDILYETEDDVWDRVQKWLYEVVGDAVGQHATESREEQSAAVAANVAQSAAFDSDGSSASLTATTLQTSTKTTSQQQIYSVFCLSHSGALRAVIRKLVGGQLPASVDLTPAGKDGAKPGMLYLPNTSITVIDIVPHSLDPKEWEAMNKEDYSKLWTATLVELTQADHLDTL